jgi:hypothetical protein
MCTAPGRSGFFGLDQVSNGVFGAAGFGEQLPYE